MYLLLLALEIHIETI